jgi:hypothetical protein
MELIPQIGNIVLVKRNIEIFEGNYDIKSKAEIKVWVDKFAKLRQEKIVIICN